MVPWFIEQLGNRKYKNPEFLYNWVDELSVDEIASNMGKENFNPHRVAQDSSEYYEGIIKRQSEQQSRRMQELQRERLKRRSFFQINASTGKAEQVRGKQES